MLEHCKYSGDLAVSELTDIGSGASTEIQGEIQYKDRTIMANKFIVGIDPQKFTDALEDSEVKARIQELQERYKGVKVILGVDRLDYIKGLTQKLKGYDYFLDHHPEVANKVVLIQVAVPSREDVKEYQELETDISTTVGKINGKHGMSLLPSLWLAYSGLPIRHAPCQCRANERP